MFFLAHYSGYRHTCSQCWVEPRPPRKESVPVLGRSPAHIGDFAGDVISTLIIKASCGTAMFITHFLE